MVLDASGALSRGKGCISIPSPSAVRRGAEEGWPCLVGEQLWRPTSHDGLFACVPTATRGRESLVLPRLPQAAPRVSVRPHPCSPAERPRDLC